MNCFQVVTAPGYKWINLANDSLFEDFHCIPEPGKPHNLGVPKVMWIDPHHRKKCIKGSASWFSGGGIVLTGQAVQVLKSVLIDTELVRLDAEGEPLFFVNPPKLKGVDLNASEFIPCPISGEPLDFTKVVLRSSFIPDYTIFKMPGRRSSSVFVTSAFVDCFSNSGLAGIGFEEFFLY
jgi:hypothetical protein